MTQKREKWYSLVLSRSDFCMIWRCHDIPCFHFYFFCLELTVKKNTWMIMISIMVMVIISKLPFWKLLDISYVQSSFPTITRHIDNGIWKSWRFYGHGSTNVLIISWISISWNENRRRCPGNYQSHKKFEPVLRRIMRQGNSSFSVKQT